MKKILGLALVAMFALSAMLATVASAETTLLAEWLKNGTAVNANLATTTEGEILLEDNKVPLFGKVAVVCSGKLIGTVGVNGADQITEVQDLAGKKIGELVGIGLLCKTQTSCENSADIEVWPDGLPWKTTLFLMENGEFLDLIEGSGYEVKCLIFGGVVEDLCSAVDTELKVENGVAPIGALTPNGAAAEPLATCAQGGANSGVNVAVGEAQIKLNNGEELTVSSEGAGR